ncbi:hypothetical protein ACVW00_003064 [Marmoricola sp. URHA0025 HA25]
MFVDRLSLLREGLPASLTPQVVDRLVARATAGPDAARVTTRAPYTGAPIADLPMANPADVTAWVLRTTTAAMSGH